MKGQQGIDFFTGGSLIIEYGLELNGLKDGFVSHKHTAFTSQDNIN